MYNDRWQNGWKRVGKDNISKLWAINGDACYCVIRPAHEQILGFVSAIKLQCTEAQLLLVIFRRPKQDLQNLEDLDSSRRSAPKS